MIPPFNTNPSFLASRLFVPDRPRIGANTFLNVNVLPDFVQYIKGNLKPEELIAISEYQLQTYIMELSIKEKVNESFDSFVQKILKYVRTRKQFWINGIIVGSKENQEKQKQQQQHQHEAIVQYQKDLQYIKTQIPDYPEKPFDNTKKRRIQPYLKILQTNFFDKSKQVLKTNVTNYPMLPAFVFRDYLREQYGVKKLPTYEELGNDQLRCLNMLENATEYLLMQQKPRKVNNQQVKRRQIVRERRLPAYLVSNQVDFLPQQQKIHEECQESLYSKQSHEIESLHLPQNANKSNIKKDEDNLLNKNQKIEEKGSQSQQSSSQEEENIFYQNFHEEISKKEFYDSKMFSKESTINQSHNIMQILRCLIYFCNDKENRWFDRKWKEIEEQRILRQQRKREEQSEKDKEDSEKNESINDEQQKYNQSEQIVQQNEQKPSLLNKNDQNEQKQPQIAYQTHEKIQTNQSSINQQNIQNHIIEQESQQSNQKIDQVQEKSQIIQIGIRKQIFDEQWRNPQTWSYNKLSKHLVDRFLTMREVYFVTKEFVNRGLLEKFTSQKKLINQREKQSKRLQDGLMDPQGTNLNEILLEYKEMIQHPENVKLGAFKTQGIKIPWDESDYLMFLKGLKEYFFIPTNNKKIAQFMVSKSSKKTIQANHVKYVKAIYLKNVQVRIDRGQSGGGKKGKMLGKLQFIDKDIESFSMRWFDKMKKSKKRLRRRRFDGDEDEAGQEVDSAY